MAIKQPADKSHFILPDLGEGVHEAELIKWRVNEGDHVEEHQTLAEMETDKALVEVPSPWAGVIRARRGEEGDIILVGSILVEYETDDHLHHETDGIEAGVTQAMHAEPGGRGEDAGTVVGSVDATLKVSDRFLRQPERAPEEAPLRALATPAVRRLARELGVDVRLVPGTGRGGRVTASDVRGFAGQGEVAEPPATTASAAPAPASAAMDEIARRIPFRGVRRKIAEGLLHSVRTAVHFTVVDEADITALDRKRHEYASVLGRRLSLLPFAMIAVCEALRRHPTVNATVDDENDEILVRSAVNLGCAVDTDHGLMVPVIPGADQLSLVQLHEVIEQRAKQCRDRSIAREHLMNGTFTVSNVGSYGGMFATPIINYPEVAILAVGRANERVMVRKGQFYAGVSLPLSLSCDHRVVDGAEGARFLNSIVKALESPTTLVRGF